MLVDCKTYINIKDSTTMMTNQTHILLARWKNMKYIDHSIYKKLNVMDGLVEIIGCQRFIKRAIH